MIKNLRVGIKLVMGFLIIIGIMVASGIFSVLYTNSVGVHGVKVGEELAPLGDAAMEVKLTSTQAYLILEKIMNGNSEENIQKAWDLLAETQWYVDAIMKGGENSEGKFYPTTNQGVIEKLKEVKRLLKEFIDSAHKHYEKKNGQETTAETTAETSGEVADTGTENDTTLNNLNKDFQTFNQLVDDAEEVIHAEMTKGLDALKAQNRKAQLATIIFIFIGMIIAIFLGTKITRAITVPLQECVRFAGHVAEGDLGLSIDVHQKDEMGQLAVAMDKMAGQLRNMIASIKESALQVNESAENIVTGSSELAMRTNEQAASLTETSTTVEQFTSILKSSSENSEDANNTLVEFNSEIQSKQDLIMNVTSTMTEISESSSQIDSIVNVINDISFQTNLLALNAAVEAARAGEAGRGFAVVASEVRNLAQKTADSSKTIQEIVTKNVESTKKGMELTRQTSEFFETIMQTLSHLASQIQEIAHGAREQSTGVDQINQAIIQLDGVVNQNSALVEQFETFSRTLKQGAGQLTEMVSRFRIDAQQKSSAPNSSPKPEPKKPEKERKSQKPIRADVKKDEPQKDDDFFSEDEGGFEEF